ncbi:hypothetical protein Back11_48900 [Paenibacillus baekrokdamisoli]|uniref:Uncharacterized protein n=1 Tax=Paenibacillus baekrokdamisoli TaxID=1712516 RepID=A0A3G9J5A4_9BACL|nr:hypothetical protein Back11_48900 [Paenibacillus baekrokdamisoli]
MIAKDNRLIRNSTVSILGLTTLKYGNIIWENVVPNVFAQNRRYIGAYNGFFVK